MAVIKLGVIVVGIRGTVGGVTFSQNKSGPTARLWSRSANPLSTFQSAQRSLTAQMPALWNALSPAQQTAWDTWAALPAQQRTNRLGETFFLSGFQAHNMINTRLLHVGRAARTAPPVLLVPAAPTITSLQLPFLDAQTAKIVYPSGTFSSPFDVIILLSVAPSIGRQVRPRLPLALLESQTPGLVDTGFLFPYLERFAQTGDTFKGFAEVSAQTTDGQRSAATGATFISTDSAPYAAAAKNFNGTTTRFFFAGIPTGAADTQKLTWSTFFRITGGAATIRKILVATNFKVDFMLNSNDRLRIRLFNAAAAQIAEFSSTTVFAADSTWHSVQISVDFTIPRVQMVIDGVFEIPTLGVLTLNAFVDMTIANWGFGAQFAGTEKWVGCLSEFWFDQTTALDFTNRLNVAQFLAPDGAPMELGTQGNFPIGTQPIFYFPDADAQVNAGHGGNFTLAGALAACATTP